MALKRLSWTLARMLFLLISVTFVAFVLVEASPLDPVAQYVASMQRGVSADQVERITALWGLDRPWYERYVSWLGGMLAGDFGVSNLYRADVAGIIGHAIANSLLLMSIAWVLSGVLGYLLGVVSGATRGTLLDRAIVAACYVLTSTPPYVVGLVLMLVFAVQLGWVPLGLSQPLGMVSADVTFLDRLRHAVLPAITVAIVAIANVTLHTRQSVSQVMESDMARFARTRGLGTWGIVRHHGLRNTLLPAVMLQFTSLSMLFGGSALAEVVFSYHGLGALITKAAIASDVPLLLGAVTLSAVLVFVGNLIADVIAILVDPRVRRSVDA
ncbi:MAG TPA: ABC transporter permease [Actinomycetales bacterium]|uniref:ABC transporter permease n=1 Tax=Corynebacterium suedekumii TaxID=3049801 RepID=A0ABY8VLW5_9CORY|nr:ABC transporter permease [Corynebacterium suedekumii]WIM70651.1 ABC transporter permease [Corynebacterium suedekumii]HHU45750.1 ABC transporter permease [Actinomycetales bacterium]